jgi:tetratricopeptide (TPR) repeat protein
LPNDCVSMHSGLQTAIDLYHENRLDDAISLMRSMTRRFPSSAKAWGYLGFLYREAHQFPESLRCFRKAVALSPKSERASLGLFYVLCRLQKFGEAFKEMGRFAKVGKPNEYLMFLSGEPRDSKNRRVA